MKTAVEWYNLKVIELMTQREQGNIDVLQFRNQLDLLLAQAKEMDKEQKIDFARLCLNKAKDLDILTSFMNAEQYYKETFKSE
jgi:hypothetical protein